MIHVNLAVPAAGIEVGGAMQYHIQPVARRVGIGKKIGWHTLRHSFATSLHRNGEGIKVVQELLAIPRVELRWMFTRRPSARASGEHRAE